jgi:hypothetical protein
VPRAVTLLDRLRIEWAVWSLDQRLYDLPRRSRIAKRRELRENLRSAAQDVGTSEALAHLGGIPRLADEYLDAELGDGPRPSWLAAAVFFLTGQLLLTSLLTDAALAFGDGITAADPDATGTYTWDGIAYLQSSVTFTFTDGTGEWVGGAWTPLGWALWIAATIAVGRLWRVSSVWHRWRRTRAAASA